MGSREWEEKSIGMLETILMNIAIKEGNHILAEEVELRIEGRIKWTHMYLLLSSNY